MRLEPCTLRACIRRLVRPGGPIVRLRCAVVTVVGLGRVVVIFVRLVRPVVIFVRLGRAVVSVVGLGGAAVTFVRLGRGVVTFVRPWLPICSPAPTFRVGLRLKRASWGSLNDCIRATDPPSPRGCVVEGLGRASAGAGEDSSVALVRVSTMLALTSATLEVRQRRPAKQGRSPTQVMVWV